MFSVIIPLEFHRGLAERCVRSWMQQQNCLPYEILLVAPEDFPSVELSLLKSLLREHDRILIRPEKHDMSLVAAGAAIAAGEVLFFTESHVWAQPDVLEKSAAALAKHPGWAGFSCRSVRVTHNALSVAEADLYEAEIERGMLHAWRKVLDQCFVVRRDAYFRAGGFDPAYGHFAEWLLAARLHELGFEIGFVPEAKVNHYYIGNLKVLRGFTQDFVDGEMSYMDRGTPDACADLLLRGPSVRRSQSFSRRIAAGMLRLVANDRSCRSMVWKLPLSSGDNARLRLRWASVVVARTWPFWLKAWVADCVLSAQIEWRASRWRPERLRSVLAAHSEAVVRRRRLEWRMKHRTSRPASTPAALLADVGAWGPGLPTVLTASGFWLPEELDGRPCVWSEPAAVVYLPLPRGDYEVTVSTREIRPPGCPEHPIFYFNEERISASDTRLTPAGAVLKISVREPSVARLAWICRPYRAPGDARSLGLLLRRIAWAPRRARDSAARILLRPPLPQDLSPVPASVPGPLLFLHIRKTAGTSLIELLSNRYHADAWLFQAHAAINANKDPNRFGMVHGHVDPGYLKRFHRRPVVFTVLRDPLERTVSAYSFFRENAASYFERPERTFAAGEEVSRRRFSEQARKMSLQEFLRQEPLLAKQHLGDIQTRQLLCPEERAALADNPAAMLEAAKRNLTSCDVVGLVERMDDTLFLLSHRMGWEGLGPIGYRNVNERRIPTWDVDAKSREILLEWNQLDYELYAHACRLFEQRLRLAEEGGIDAASPSALPDAAHFTFDQPIHGYGWYSRERTDGQLHVWTGAGACRDAWIDLSTESGGAHALRCRIVHILHQRVLDGLRIFVNGHAVDTECSREGAHVMVKAIVPGSIMNVRPQMPRIQFSVAELLRPIDLDARSGDERTLGLALGSISMEPIQAS